MNAPKRQAEIVDRYLVHNEVTIHDDQEARPRRPLVAYVQHPPPSAAPGNHGTPDPGEEHGNCARAGLVRRLVIEAAATI